MALDLPPPNDLGAPLRYNAWRAHQDKAVARLMSDPKRFVVLAQPTGSGKSLAYMTYLAFTGKRGLVLTSTTGLQDQVRADYAEIGLTDVRGMSHYECLAEGGTCDTGSCVDGAACHMKDRGCLYFDAVRGAEGAMLPSTNYAFWFTRKRNGQGLGKIDVLVCDEAASIENEMSAYLKVELRPDDVRIPDDAEGMDSAAWAAWAGAALPGLQDKVKRAPKYDRRRLREVERKVASLVHATGAWVCERGWRGSVALEPVSVAPYLESWLWQGIPKVVLASATITERDVKELGIAKGAYSFVEYPSPIPVAQRPVVHVRSGVRLSARTPDYEWQHIVDLMDATIEDRLDRKGIIDSISYPRAEFIKSRSRFAAIMLTHDKGNAKAVIAAFKASEAPCVLVSPVIHTGFDFAYDLARYILLPKAPFPPPSPLMKARTALDREYPYRITLKRLVQAAGRVARAPDDSGEVICYDDMLSWLYWKYRYYTPRYFQLAWRTTDSVPAPPKMFMRKGLTK